VKDERLSFEKLQLPFGKALQPRKVALLSYAGFSTVFSES
jgi:hypothetical protein